MIAVTASDPTDTETLAEVLAAHADCTLNDNRGSIDTAAAVTGLDVWSCGVVVPFSERLEDAERLHLATAIAARIVQARAGETALREAARLEPAENMALTVAWHQVERGEHPMGNVAAVCVMALERIRRAALDTTGGTP